MKEAIERVIKELEGMRKNHQVESYKDVSVASSAYHDGVCIGLLMSIDKLKEVLTQHETDNPRSSGSGGQDDATK